MPVDYDQPAVGDAVATAGDESSPRSLASSPISEAVQRFRSCRWRRAPEDGQTECCTHRDVLPLTGTKGFDPEAWCPGCAFFKLRRNPRKNF